MFGERWSSHANATAMGGRRAMRHRVQGVGLQRGEAAQGEIGHVGDVLGGKGVDQVVVASMGDVVEVLDAHDRRDRLSLGDLFGRHGAHPEVPDESLLLELRERGELLGERPGSAAPSPPTRRLTTSRASRPSWSRLSWTPCWSSSGERAWIQPPVSSRRAPTLVTIRRFSGYGCRASLMISLVTYGP